MMKISEAKKMYSTQLEILQDKKRELSKLLKESPTHGQNYDRTELSRELRLVSEGYDQVKAGMEQLHQKEMLTRNAEMAKNETRSAR